MQPCPQRAETRWDARQPVHTFYQGAHLFTADVVARLRAEALHAFDRYGGDPATFAEALGLDGSTAFADMVHRRVRAKLEREPVEDYRLDFEDGYGNQPDDEEDACAASAARELAAALDAAALPPFMGIRIKSLSGTQAERGLRTLDIFVTTLLATSRGRLPDNLVVTLPKVTSPAQVSSLVGALERLEEQTGVTPGTLKLEIMIETTESILDADGRCALPGLVAASGAGGGTGGRCTGAHFGVYDYTASCGIAAAHQQMSHPACDFARHMMQVALAGTGVSLSDGATNVLPVPPHAESDAALSSAQQVENTAAIHRAWRLHYRDVRRSLERAFYQGWDLHPAQLPTRYAAVFAFYLESLEAATQRLRSLRAQAADTSRAAGDIADDAATDKALCNYIRRGRHCGAITETEALATGLTLDELSP